MGEIVSGGTNGAVGTVAQWTVCIRRRKDEVAQAPLSRELIRRNSNEASSLAADKSHSDNTYGMGWCVTQQFRVRASPARDRTSGSKGNSSTAITKAALGEA